MANSKHRHRLGNLDEQWRVDAAAAASKEMPTMNRRFVRLRVALLTLSLGAALVPSHSSAEPSSNLCDRTIVDYIWTGTRVNFESTTTDRYTFIAYFDAERHLTVARIDLETCAVARKRLPSQFKGWDSHNANTIALDAQGRLHVSGNMHSAPLAYFRSRQPLDIETLEPAPMVGQDEERVTYPRFLRLKDGFFFVYRDGVAGNGEWYMNKWVDGRWQRVTAKPVFGADSKGVVASAYPSEFVVGPDGYFHVAVVWRGDRGVENNFRLSYARTRDFRHWFRHNGRELSTPLEPDTMETVDDVGRNGGLVNNAKIAVDPEGTPYVTYTKYTEDGKNGVYFAKPEADKWNSRLLAESQGKTLLRGGGTISPMPSFSAVQFNINKSGAAVVAVRFPGEPAKGVGIPHVGGRNEGTAAPTAKSPTNVRRDPLFSAVLPMLDKPDIIISRPSNAANGASANVRFAWVAQAPNRDVVRKCTPARPSACKPPASPLVLLADH